MALVTQSRNKNRLRPDIKEVRTEREKAPVRRRPDLRQKEHVLNMKARAGRWLLMPICLLGLFAFMELFLHASLYGGLWRSPEFLCFLGGAAAWLGLFFVFRRTSPVLYVYGHEMTHLITAKLCGAVVYDWHVGRDGGWVDTNKSNLLISLSPYFVPFYTVIVMLFFGVGGLFADLHQVYSFHLGSVVVPVNVPKVMYYLIGFTWSFHASFTMRVMREDQSDLVRNDQFFSVCLITLINVSLIATFLVTVSTDGWPALTNSLHSSVIGTLASLYHGFCWMVTSLWEEIEGVSASARAGKA